MQWLFYSEMPLSYYPRSWIYTFSFLILAGFFKDLVEHTSYVWSIFSFSHDSYQILWNVKVLDSHGIYSAGID